MINSHTLDTIKERSKKEVTMDYKIKGDSDCPIIEINLQNNETVKIERGSMAYYLNNGAFLACDNTVSYEMKTQSVGKALFGGTGGFFVMHTSGQGDLLINAYGDIMEINVDADHPIIIDNEHVIAWDDSLDYEIKIASGTFGFTTGEGLVNEFHGTGKVYIQSRNLHSLADALTPFIPQGKD